jgi:hypothetical protein
MDAPICSRVRSPLQCDKPHHRNSERRAQFPPVTSIVTGIKGATTHCLPRWVVARRSRPSPWNLRRRQSPQTRPNQVLPPPSPIRRSRSWPTRQCPRRRPFASTSCLISWRPGPRTSPRKWQLCAPFCWLSFLFATPLQLPITEPTFPCRRLSHSAAAYC